MTSIPDGMLKVFISSSLKDLKPERQSLINRINESLSAIGMESFVSDGRTSQEIALLDDKMGLKNCDLAIFIISPYYGTLINECHIIDCKADCEFKRDKTKKISYTHCEYKFAIAEKIPMQIYIIDRDWNIIKKFKELGLEEVDWNTFIKHNEIKNLDPDYAEHLFSVKDQVTEFREEIEKNFCPRIDASEDISIISDALSENIVNWYNEGKINIKDFCGRRKELKELLEKMDDSVEVYGVGGIGKTTLIHVALLIEKLRGKKILSIGKKQSYFSGSGFNFFKEKCKSSLFEITGEIISINDILDALNLLSTTKNEGLKEKIRLIGNKISDDNLIIFVDDFHLADNTVKELVKSSKGFVVSSKAITGIARNELHLSGIEESERDFLIDLICRRLGKSISEIAREKIKQIAEGHPVSTEILVRNFDRIDFKELEDYKRDALNLSNPDHVQEFLKRVINDILTKESFDLLKLLSMINTALENDINKKIIEKTFTNSNVNSLFLEIIDRGFLRKKQQKENIFEFSFKHIQDSLKDEGSEYHKKAADYYKNKIQMIFDNIEDQVELLFHQIKTKYDSTLFRKFIKISSNINPTNYGYKGLIEIGKELEDHIEKDEIPHLWNILGRLNKDINWYENAEEYITKALRIQRELVTKNRRKYILGLGSILNNLGNLYLDLNCYNKAHEAYIEALDILEEFPPTDPIKQKQNSVSLFNNIGLCYHKLEQYSESKDIYLKAISIIETIPKNHRKTIRELEASIYTNLGMLYVETHKYKDAESALKNSLKLNKELSITNPAKYKGRYIGNLQNLGIFYKDLNRFYESEKIFRESLELMKDLTERSPDAFQSDYAGIQNNLANNLHKLKKNLESELLYQSSCNIISKLYNENKDVYRLQFIRFFNNFGGFYLHVRDFTKAKKILETCLEKFGELQLKKSDAYLREYSDFCLYYAILYEEEKENAIAANYYEDALQSCRDLIEKDKSAFLPMFTEILTKYGEFCFKNGKNDFADKLLTESLLNGRYLLMGCQEANEPILTESLIINGLLSMRFRNFSKSKELLKEALIKGEALKNKCPEAFTRLYIKIINAFGLYYCETQDYERSLFCLNNALDLAQDQVKQYEKSESGILLDVLFNFEGYYLKTNDPIKRKEISEEISKIKKEYGI